MSVLLLDVRAVSVALLGAGCVQASVVGVTRSELLARCAGAYVDGRPAPLVPSSDLGPVDADCAAAAGDVVGMDWGTFGESPHAFDTPSTSAELVVAAVVALAGPHALDAGVLLGDGAPAGWSAHGALLVSDPRETGDDLGGLLFAAVDHLATDTSYNPSMNPLMSVSAGHVGVSDLAFADDPNPFAVPYALVFVAAVLVHESAHAVYQGGHPAICPETGEPGCDADADGAYGVGALWVHATLEAYAGELDDGECALWRDALFAACGGIADPGDFAPCTAETLDRDCDAWTRRRP